MIEVYFALKLLYRTIVTIGGASATFNKPGTAQVGAISKAQKQQKDLKWSEYSLLRYRKNPKVEPNWRTRGDTLRFFIHPFCGKSSKKMKEGHFW